MVSILLQILILIPFCPHGGTLVNQPSESPFVNIAAGDSFLVDLDLDGYEELIVFPTNMSVYGYAAINSMCIYELGDHSNPYQIIFNESFSSYLRDFASFHNYSEIAWGDFDANGYMDLLTKFHIDLGNGRSYKPIRMLEFKKTEHGTWSIEQTFSTEQNGDIKDLNSDGLWEIIVYDQWIPIRALWESTPYWRWAAIYSPDKDNGGYQLANLKYESVVKDSVSYAINRFEDMVAFWRTSTSPGEHVWDVYYAACQVMNWKAVLLDETAVNEWYEKQHDLLLELKAEQSLPDAYWLDEFEWMKIWLIPQIATVQTGGLINTPIPNLSDTSDM